MEQFKESGSESQEQVNKIVERFKGLPLGEKLSLLQQFLTEDVLTKYATWYDQEHTPPNDYGPDSYKNWGKDLSSAVLHVEEHNILGEIVSKIVKEFEDMKKKVDLLKGE